MGRVIDRERELKTLAKVVMTISIFLATISDGLAGRMTKLPGGVKCADLFNNDQPICVFEIQIGRITAGTPDDVRYLLEHRNSYPQKIWGSGVALDSLGGDVAASIEIGRLMRDQNITATISSSAKCVSACVFVLAGASQRKIKGAVGIHRPYFTTMGNSTANSPDAVIHNYRELVKQVRDYLTDMGVAPRLLDEMLRIEPNDVRYLTRTELEAYGLGEGAPGDDVENIKSVVRFSVMPAAAISTVSRSGTTATGSRHRPRVRHRRASHTAWRSRWRALSPRRRSMPSNSTDRSPPNRPRAAPLSGTLGAAKAMVLQQARQGPLSAIALAAGSAPAGPAFHAAGGFFLSIDRALARSDAGSGAFRFRLATCPWRFKRVDPDTPANAT
jgi:hypothetical protein